MRESIANVEERRLTEFGFPSLKSMKLFFYFFLPEVEVRTVVAGAKSNFRIRRGCSHQETLLQFIKKCESELLRLLLGPVNPAAEKP